MTSTKHGTWLHAVLATLNLMPLKQFQVTPIVYLLASSYCAFMKLLLDAVDVPEDARANGVGGIAVIAPANEETTV